MWTIIALTKLGFGDKALEYYRMINPVEHSRTKEAANKYKAEPFSIAADIYGSGSLARKRRVDMVYRVVKLVFGNRTRAYIGA